MEEIIPAKEFDETEDLDEIEKDELDESELEDAILDDLLPTTDETSDVTAVVYSKKNKKPVKIKFIIRKGINFPDLVEADKALYDINKKGETSINFLNFIVKIWPKIVVKQPPYFRQQIRDYAKDVRALKKGSQLKNPSCKIDGFIMKEIIQTVYLAFQSGYDIEKEKDKQIKN